MSISLYKPKSKDTMPFVKVCGLNIIGDCVESNNVNIITYILYMSTVCGNG